MIAFGLGAYAEGFSVIIAAAGGAAHLPGMLASVTSVPVIGVPVPITALDGMDALLSIVQMPAGIPVATMAIGGAENASLMAIRILALSDSTLRDKLAEHRSALEEKAHLGNEEIQRLL
jgi:5-(carboxyamino)imidazole ribonucleotide mutase